MTKQKVLVLYFCVCFLGNQNEVTTTPAKEPYADPPVEIPRSNLYDNEGVEIDPFEKQPEVLREKEELRRHQEELDKIGDKDPFLKEQLDLEFRRKNRPMIDWISIHDRNIQEQNMMPPLRPQMPPQPKPISPIDEETGADKISEFRFGHFHIDDEAVLRAPKKKNWTTCEQFRRDAPVFVPDDIIGINWVPFYQYSSYEEVFEESPVTVFTRITHNIVEQYYKKYGRIKSNYTVNWNKPAMLMKQAYRGLEMILVQSEINGLFYGVVDIGLPVNDENDLVKLALNIQITTMQFKIFENYLAMMYCEMTMALLMAREGFEPPSKSEKEEIGQRFPFKGVGRILLRDLVKEKEIFKMFGYQNKEDAQLKNAQPKPPTDDEYPEYGPMQSSYSNQYNRYNQPHRFSESDDKMTRGGWERFE